MKKAFLILLCAPLFLLFGLAQGLAISWLVRGREPWLTLGMLGGLSGTIALVAWGTDTPAAWTGWTLAAAGGIYLGMRLLFGTGSSLEMMVPAHVLAIFMLLARPAYEHAQQKASRSPIHHAAAAALAPTAAFLYQTSTASSLGAGE